MLTVWVNLFSVRSRKISLINILILNLCLIIIISTIQAETFNFSHDYSDNGNAAYSQSSLPSNIIPPPEHVNPFIDDTTSREYTTRSNGGVGDETPFADDWVEATYNIQFQEPALVNLDAKFLVHEINLGTIYGNVSAAQIRVLSDGDESSTIITYLKSQIEKEIFGKFLEITFPEGDYNYQSSSVDESTLQATTGIDNYHPAIEVTLSGYAILPDMSYFNKFELAEYNITNLNDLIEGSLKMGAKVTQILKLGAKAGHKNEFQLSVPFYSSYQHPEQLIISYPLDEDKGSDYLVVRTIDNKDGIAAKIESLNDLTFRAVSPTPDLKAGVNEDINIQLDLDVLHFDEIYLRPSLLEIAVVDLSSSSINLPENITGLSHMSSDGIRLYYDNGIIDEEDIQESIDAELAITASNLQTRLNSSTAMELVLEWDFTTIVELEPLYYLEDTGTFDYMGSDRPIKGYVTARDKIVPHLFETNFTVNTIYGFLNAGAEARLNLRIKSKYDYNINLTLPQGLRLKGMLGKPGTRDNYLISEYDADDILLISKIAPVYRSNRAFIDVEVDIKELEMVNFNEYVTEVRIEVEGVLHRILSSAHSGFNMVLPDSITMAYVNSDAFRLAYSENLIDLNEITDEIYNIIYTNLTKVFEGTIEPNVQFDTSSMQFNGDINKMDDEVPIEFKITAEGDMKIGSGGSGLLSSFIAAIDNLKWDNGLLNEDDFKLAAFISQDIEIPLVGKPGWNTTYKIILPHYIEIIGTPELENLSGSATEVVTGTVDGGRHYMQVTIYSDDPGITELRTVATIDINITPWYFLSKIIIPLILSIILLILIIYIYLKRRHKSKILEQEIGGEGVSVTDLNKYKLVRPKRKGKQRHITDLEFVDELKREPGAEPDFYSEQGEEPIDFDHMSTISDESYSGPTTRADYKQMVKEMVPGHQGKIKRNKDKAGRNKGRRRRSPKNKGRKKVMSGLSIILILLLFAIASPLKVHSQVDDEYISSPGNIPQFEFTSPATIIPGDAGRLNFKIENRYSIIMTNVTLTVNIFKCVTIEDTKEVEGLKDAPKIVHASGGTRYAILDGQTIQFQWSKLNNNTQEPIRIKISTLKDTHQGTYFVRMNLTFEYESRVYILNSRGHYSQAEWDYAHLTSNPTDPGDINLTALGVDGIIPDTSFRVKDPIPLWPLILFAGLSVFFAVLAGIFYFMDEHGKFPKTKAKLDRFSERFHRKRG